MENKPFSPNRAINFLNKYFFEIEKKEKSELDELVKKIKEKKIIKEEIKKKLTERESYSLNNHKLSPFVILSSGAVVTNSSSNVLSAIKSGAYGASAYYGCVISNQTSLNLMYQTADTILGFDLNGKQIKIEGESGRKISTPIIESVEIDTDGGNNKSE